MKKRILLYLGALAVLGGAVALVAWHKLFREEPEPELADAQWVKYGSLGGEAELGIPYWIWLVLPRAFPDLVGGAGGYRAFGVAWEEGHEMPIGFTKRTIGFARVGNNCALCHTASYRAGENASPTFVFGAPANQLDVQRLLRFFASAAKDARFDADVLMPLIEREVELSFLDGLLYRYLLIPLTRKAFLEQGDKFAWVDRHQRPPWGCGRDDSFNLPKFALAEMADDGSTGQCDFGALWNLEQRKGAGRLLNWGGESPDVYTVLVDSSVGLGARPGARFDRDMERLGKYFGALQPPAWPFARDEQRAARGAALYQTHCARCHEPGGELFCRVVPLAEIGTDPERHRTWTQAAADATNRAINEGLGAPRPDVITSDGYLAGPLTGAWLSAPYLHNGSVPNLRELLEPAPRRTARFVRGYDVYDPVNVGFVHAGAEAERVGFVFDTTLRGNGNSGHEYGCDLPDERKLELLEYLKTK
jgi:mono/diheme cytochrome c family protein